MEKIVYFNQMPVRLAGNLPKVGDAAPDFMLAAQDLNDIRLSDYKGRRVVLNIFPSLDTDVCALSVKKFNEMVAKLKNTSVLCVSEDLPFAAARFCVANGIKNVETGSSFRSSFGENYGMRILDGPLRGLLTRGIIVVNEDGDVAGVSICDQIASEPDYDFVFSILK